MHLEVNTVQVHKFEEGFTYCTVLHFGFCVNAHMMWYIPHFYSFLIYLQFYFLQLYVTNDGLNPVTEKLRKSLKSCFSLF